MKNNIIAQYSEQQTLNRTDIECFMLYAHRVYKNN